MTLMTTAAAYRSSVASRLTWAGENLFNTRANTLLSLAAIGISGFVAFR